LWISVLKKEKNLIKLTNEIYNFNEGFSCKNKTFRVFAKVELLSRSEVSKKIWARRRELVEVKRL
jgi:hypothetical protein